MNDQGEPVILRLWFRQGSMMGVWTHRAVAERNVAKFQKGEDPYDGRHCRLSFASEDKIDRPYAVFRCEDIVAMMIESYPESIQKEFLATFKKAVELEQRGDEWKKGSE